MYVQTPAEKQAPNLAINFFSAHSHHILILTHEEIADGRILAWTRGRAVLSRDPFNTHLCDMEFDMQGDLC